MSSDTLAYVVSSVLWSLGGGIFGFLIGRLTAGIDRVDREVHEVHSLLEGQATMYDDDDAAGRRGPRGEKGEPGDPGPVEVSIVREPDSKSRWWFGIILLVLAVASSVTSVISTSRATDALNLERELRQCVERRFTDFAENIEARGQATTRDFAAIETMVRSVLVTTEGNGDASRALRRYLEQREEAQRIRESNPLTLPMVETCRQVQRGNGR